MAFEFTGKPFDYAISLHFGPHGTQSSYDKYKIYQNVKGKIYSTALIFGINIIQKKRHVVSMNALVHFNTYQKTTFSNYYANEQFGYDTTKYKIVKNNISTSKFTYLLYPSFLLNYTYKLNQKISVDFNLQLMYPLYYFGYYADHYFPAQYSSII